MNQGKKRFKGLGQAFIANRGATMSIIKEYTDNYEYQKMFVRGELQAVLLYEVVFFDSSQRNAPTQQKFFFYERKWRNTVSKSVWGAVTFNENEIRPTAHY